MTTKTLPFFVYGTLRPGQSNHYLLDGVELSMEDGSITGYDMDTNGAFPYIFPGSNTVHGTLITLKNEADYPNVLARLDRLEGYRGDANIDHYTRTSVTVHTSNGQVEAWVYVANILHGYQPIPSGNWLDFVHNDRESQRL